MKRLFLIAAFVLLSLLYIFRFWQFSFCKNFNPQFTFSSPNLIEEVEKASGPDKGMERATVRFFHNKLNVGAFEVVKRYFLSFEPRILFETISPIGALLFFLAAYQILKERRGIGLMFLFFSLLAPFFLLKNQSPTSAFFLLSVPRQIISFWSVNKFLKLKYGSILLLFLFGVSFWYFIFSFRFSSICQ